MRFLRTVGRRHTGLDQIFVCAIFEDCAPIKYGSWYYTPSALPPPLCTNQIRFLVLHTFCIAPLCMLQSRLRSSWFPPDPIVFF